MGTLVLKGDSEFIIMMMDESIKETKSHRYLLTCQFITMGPNFLLFDYH